jgi:3-deoxy-manno-octulosonate cytidylyltransferase (CMP-KDO synthetase)
MSPTILAVIPARYASSRFPGKPLANIHGKPMIKHVVERVRQVIGLHQVIVATDHVEIFETVRAFGGQAQLTRTDHASGTDRIWEVAKDYPEADWVLNVQGDEPFIPVSVLETMIQGIKAYPQADILTAMTPLRSQDEADSPHVVKIALAQSGQALYFSRLPIPARRDHLLSSPSEKQNHHWQSQYRHLGLYLYRKSVLQHLVQLPVCPLEQFEQLEQLRALDAGYRIFCMAVENAPIGVDTPEDLETLLKTSGCN